MIENNEDISDEEEMAQITEDKETTINSQTDEDNNSKEHDNEEQNDDNNQNNDRPRQKNAGAGVNRLQMNLEERDIAPQYNYLPLKKTLGTLWNTKIQKYNL